MFGHSQGRRRRLEEISHLHSGIPGPHRVRDILADKGPRTCNHRQRRAKNLFQESMTDELDAKRLRLPLA